MCTPRCVGGVIQKVLKGPLRRKTKKRRGYKGDSKEVDCLRCGGRLLVEGTEDCMFCCPPTVVCLLLLSCLLVLGEGLAISCDTPLRHPILLIKHACARRTDLGRL